MPYDDQSTKNFEQKYREWLKQIRKLTPEKMDEINKLLLDLEKGVNVLRNKKHRTREENETLKKVFVRIKDVKKTMEDMQLVLGQKMVRNALAFYQSVKKKAAEGDERAKKILKDLEPEYKKMLKAQHPDN